MSSKCVRRCASQLRNRENGFSFFPGSRPGGRHTSQVGTIPLLFRNVLPRQVFRGQIPDCCGPTISKPGQFMQLPAFLRSTVVLPCKGGRKTADTAPPPLPLSSLPLPFPSPWVVQAQAPLRGAFGRNWGGPRTSGSGSLTTSFYRFTCVLRTAY